MPTKTTMSPGNVSLLGKDGYNATVRLPHLYYKKYVIMYTIQKFRAATVGALLLVCLLYRFGHAQTYSTDFSDIKSADTDLAGHSMIRGIGEVGELKKILDLRGFVPFSLVSKSKSNYQDESVFHFFTDIFQWYQVPTEVGVSRIYYGKDDDKAFLQCKIDDEAERKIKT